MKKTIITFALLLSVLLNMKGQTDSQFIKEESDPGFSSVTLVNGKVVFEQFIIIEKGVAVAESYAKLKSWAEKRYIKNPLLSGIRFNEKSEAVTISVGANLKPNLSGQTAEEILMNYRIDISITGAGCLLIIRDITYQGKKIEDESFFPKIYTAEESITDPVMLRAGEKRPLIESVRKLSIEHFNEIYSDLKALF